MRKEAWTIAVGLLAVGAALALPAPSPSPALNATPAGPPRLADTWPSAKPISIVTAQPDGSSLQPLLVLDGPTVVGLASSADLTSSRLVIRSADGSIRPLRTWTGAQPVSTVAAIVAAAGTLYWLERAGDEGGNSLVTLWRTELAGGQPQQLAAEPTDLLYYNSRYDLQVVDGLIVWAVLSPQGGTEIHSLPIGGGAIAVRALERRYALSAWPWVTSSIGGIPGDVELLNLSSGERRTVAAGLDELVDCTPVWCRVTTLINQRRALTFELERIDGSQRIKTKLTPINNDIALLDRFEVLASVDDARPESGQSLWLLDLDTGRQVLLENNASASTGSRGPFLWWSTGDNETVVWHILDLRQLS